MKKILIGFGAIILLAGLALVFCIYLRPNLIISKADAKARFSIPESKFIHWKGAEIHYTDTGKGPAILMIHGFGGNFANFNALAGLMQDSFRIIRVDLPGFGLSDMPELPDSNRKYIPLYRNFISFFIDNLHLDSVYVVGNSMGGWMAWELAAHRPDKVKKLVLLNSAGYDMHEVSEHIRNIGLLRSPLTRKLMERGIPMMLSESTAHRIRAEGEPIDMEEVKVMNGIANRQGNFQNLIALATCGELPDTSLITKVQCPTLIVWGKQDIIVPYQHALKFRRDIKHSSMALYDPCGHVPMMEFPERLAADLRKFFSAQ